MTSFPISGKYHFGFLAICVILVLGAKDTSVIKEELKGLFSIMN